MDENAPGTISGKSKRLCGCMITLRPVRRIVIGIVGSLVLLLGVAMLFLPGPAWCRSRFRWDLRFLRPNFRGRVNGCTKPGTCLSRAERKSGVAALRRAPAESCALRNQSRMEARKFALRSPSSFS